MDESGELRECEPATDASPLRQGDVFEWLTRKDADPFRQFGVIVTADCDLARAKHQGIISCVPILPLRDYFRMFHLPRRVKSSLSQVGDELVAVVRKAQERMPEFPEPMSKDAALGWVLRETPEGIAKALVIRDEKSVARVSALVDDYKALSASADEGSFQLQLEALAGFRARTRGSIAAKALGEIVGELAQVAETLPGDAFFIGNVADGEGLGHVAYLRMVREIQQEAIAIRATELASASAKRVSRMCSPYLYRMTQQLADVFAAIGLPTEYEEQRRSIARSLVDAPPSPFEDDEGGRT